LLVAPPSFIHVFNNAEEKKLNILSYPVLIIL